MPAGVAPGGTDNIIHDIAPEDRMEVQRIIGQEVQSKISLPRAEIEKYARVIKQGNIKVE